MAVCWFVAALAAGGALVVLAAPSAAAEAKGGDPPAIGIEVPFPFDEPANMNDPDDVALRTLAAKWRKPDGTTDQDALVALLKKRLDAVNKKLMATFKMTETPHYLVCSDADTAVTGQFVTWCEALYNNLSSLFGLKSGDHVWDAKCMLFLFKYRSKFEQYSLMLDSRSAKRAGAYFAVENYRPGEPRLVKICIPVDEKEPRKLQEYFAHEGTHAFFEVYRKPAHLPLWLHEGLAEYMTIVNDRTLRQPKVAVATKIGRSGGTIQQVLLSRTGDMLAWEDYCVSMTLVDFLIAAGKPKFKKFVEALKDGTAQEKALPAAYGFTLDDLEQRWRTYVTDYLPRHP
jgi:hypothetical protein